jgi:hypothetical protein
MDARAQSFPKSGRIFIFGFLSAIAPLSIDIYLPALPMLRQALEADEAQTLNFCVVFATSVMSRAQPSISVASLPSSLDHRSSISTISGFHRSTTDFYLA